MWYFHNYECGHGTALHRLLGGTAAATVATTKSVVTAVQTTVGAIPAGVVPISIDSHIVDVANHGSYQFNNTKFDDYSFLFAHCFCVVAHVITALCYKYGQYEIGKFFDISRVPIYFYFIFRAHFYELNMLSH
jgi:hypothetical protein